MTNSVVPKSLGGDCSLKKSGAQVSIMSGHDSAQKSLDSGTNLPRDLSGAKRKRMSTCRDEFEYLQDDHEKRASSFVIVGKNLPKKSRPCVEVPRAVIKEKSTGGHHPKSEKKAGAITEQFGRNESSQRNPTSRRTGEEVSDVVGIADEEAHPIGITTFCGVKRKRRSAACDECEFEDDLDHLTVEHAAMIEKQPLKRKLLKSSRQEKKSKTVGDFPSMVLQCRKKGKHIRLTQNQLSTENVSVEGSYAQSLVRETNQRPPKMNPLNFPLW
eukprot:TRINITY_DN11101_c0_g2_i1.p1 TRINITY_DN11101_c0_g2~~TRINITY_DN11101_c0_g2_i1.p1  ORF type:complete len:271 (-),score=54.98 TRINITY_DN11101_c0_g2_i1:631-1443(-)